MSDTPPAAAPAPTEVQVIEAQATVVENKVLTFVRAHAVAATATGTVVGFLVGLLF